MFKHLKSLHHPILWCCLLIPSCSAPTSVDPFSISFPDNSDILTDVISGGGPRKYLEIKSYHYSEYDKSGSGLNPQLKLKDEKLYGGRSEYSFSENGLPLHKRQEDLYSDGTKDCWSIEFSYSYDKQRNIIIRDSDLESRKSRAEFDIHGNLLIVYSYDPDKDIYRKSEEVIYDAQGRREKFIRYDEDGIYIFYKEEWTYSGNKDICIATQYYHENENVAWQEQRIYTSDRSSCLINYDTPGEYTQIQYDSHGNEMRVSFHGNDGKIVYPPHEYRYDSYGNMYLHQYNTSLEISKIEYYGDIAPLIPAEACPDIYARGNYERAQTMGVTDPVYGTSTFTGPDAVYGYGGIQELSSQDNSYWEDFYRTTYARYESLAASIFTSLSQYRNQETNSGATSYDRFGSNTSSLLNKFNEAQRDMSRVRNEAAQHGVYITQSSWETTSVNIY